MGNQGKNIAKNQTESEIKATVCREAMENLRRDEDEPKVWRLAGRGKHLRSDRWLPWRRLWAGGSGDIVLWRDGNALGFSKVADTMTDLELLKMEVMAIGTLSGEPLEAIVVEAGIVRLVMKDAPSLYLKYDGNGMEQLGEMPELPGLRMRKKSGGRLTEGVGTVGLSGSGLRNGSLGTDDVRKLTTAMNAAYQRLKARGVQNGYYIQPVVARYRLEDKQGGVVGYGPLVLLSADGGMQVTGEIAMSGDSSLGSVGGGVLETEGYSVEVESLGALPAPWNRIVSRCVVEISEEIDPVESGVDVSVRVVNNGNSTSTLHCRLGGSAVVSAEARVELVKATLRRGADIMRDRGALPYPFATAGATARCGYLHGSGNVANGGFNSPANRELVKHNVAKRVGDLMVYGNRLEESFSGYRPQEMTTSTIGWSWKGMIVTLISRPGESTEQGVSTGYGNGDAPAKIGGMLMYPSEYAEWMEVTIDYGNGKVRRERYELTPLPEVGIAVWIAPDLQGSEPAGEIDALVPQMNKLGRRRVNGLVEISQQSTPGAPTTEYSISEGVVTAVAEAPRSRSSWDFSRRKLLIFGRFGCRVLTLDGNNRIHSAGVLDNRSVESGGSVAECTGAQGGIVTAVAGDYITEASQSGMKVRAHAPGAARGIEEVRWGELWIFGGEEELRWQNSAGEMVKVSGEWTRGARGALWGGRLLVQGGDGLRSAGAEEFDGSGMGFSYEKRMELPTRVATRGGVITVEIGMESSDFRGEIWLSGDNGGDDRRRISTLSVSGGMRCPLRVRVLWSGMRFLTVRIAGHGGQGTAIRSVRIYE